jgi:hypothetical protein
VQKRAQGRKRIGKRNFKKRWLRVNNRELSYHKHRGKDMECTSREGCNPLWGTLIEI